MEPFSIANDLMHQPQKLRDKARAEGYLFFRELIDPAELANVRAQILAICEDHRWLKSGTDPADGIAANGVAHIEGQPTFFDVYEKVLALEDFHALAHTPKLIGIFDALFGEPTLVHPRTIARIIFPKVVQYSTPAHQDFIHIRGTEETWTAWIPLSDCPQTLGSLAVLPGSHTSGIFPTRDALGAGGKGIDTDTLPYTWTASDFEAGDVIVFHSLLVHKGLPNLTEDRLRISVDYRFQGQSQPIDPASLEPHHGRNTWDALYAGWKSDRHQYYWKQRTQNACDRDAKETAAGSNTNSARS
ncbi:MAG: phytanoyl-CoA dioxygenase family protein [Capsulimonadaceae bacterium]|nr:phytanoyl-CoA dioxygenase family protein [Capsulimonadaceae bacterium]